MTELYPDVICGACGELHALCHRTALRHRPGVAFTYTCPATRQVVRVRPPRAPEIVILAPAAALPLTWASD